MCNNRISYTLEKDFQNYVSKSDSVLFDGDFLHPKYAFMQNGKIIGIEINDNPECGNYTKRIYINNDEIEKITLRKDYYSQHCGEIIDSIYVIEPHKQKIMTYVNFKPSKDI